MNRLALASIGMPVRASNIQVAAYVLVRRKVKRHMATFCCKTSL